ncbi:MAG: DUF971 domain-containing protein [Chloroflexota bacterium]
MNAANLRIQPVDITKHGNESLEGRWADGPTRRYPLRELRRVCPCADCRKRREEVAEQTGPFRVLRGREPSTVPAKLEQTGNYAISITWSDRHHSIFAFDGLRAVCPCAECERERSGE